MTSRPSNFILAATTAICLAMASPANAVLGFDDATEITQLANNAQLLLMKANQLRQIQNELEMLAGFDLNNAASFLGVTGRAQSLLGQLDGVLYDVSSVAGMIEERYPDQYPSGTTLEQLVTQTQGWRAVERNAVAESHLLQSRINAEMVMAAERDRNTLDASMTSPGIRSAIQAGNQLTGSLLAEVRNLQLANLTHARAVETQALKETGKQAQRQALYCEHFKHSKTPFPGCR